MAKQAFETSKKVQKKIEPAETKPEKSNNISTLDLETGEKIQNQSPQLYQSNFGENCPEMANAQYPQPYYPMPTPEIAQPVHKPHIPTNLVPFFQSQQIPSKHTGPSQETIQT
jgi:hypothetical protein